MSERSEDIDLYRMQNHLDVKYELFLKWLQSNELVGDTQTDDECTSHVLTSEDEDDFVDTEMDFPLILLPEENTPEPNDRETNFYTTLLSADSMHDLCGGDSRTPTPSLLSVMSVTDYDSSTSDISGISDSTNLAKRKARHNKGKAPPIPIPLPVQLMQMKHEIECESQQINDVPVLIEEKSEKKTILNFLPGLFRSKSPVKNPSEAETASGCSNEKVETQI